MLNVKDLKRYTQYGVDAKRLIYDRYIGDLTKDDGFLDEQLKIAAYNGHNSLTVIVPDAIVRDFNVSHLWKFAKARGLRLGGGYMSFNLYWGSTFLFWKLNKDNPYVVGSERVLP